MSDEKLDFKIAKIGPDAVDDGSEILAQILDGTNDDPDAVEADEGDLANLQGEFDSVARLTDRKKVLEAELSSVKQALAAQKDRMIDAMEKQGTKQFRSAAGDGSCTITERFDTKVNDDGAFIEWVQETHPELLTVNSQRRNKFIRENFRDQGIDPESDEFPPGIEVSPRRGLMVRDVKANQKKD
jgi:hypothetical protein